MGWYDVNLVILNLLTPEKSARNLIKYLEDAHTVLKKVKKNYENGEYQWVAQITKEIIFATPSNKEARELCAKSLEQIAGIKRNMEKRLVNGSHLNSSKEQVSQANTEAIS